MKALLLPLLALLAAAPVQGRSAPPAQDQDPGQDPGRVPTVQLEGDYYVLNFSEDPDNVVTLEEFVILCKEATGRQFTYNDQTQAQLRQFNVFLLGTKRIPKQDFYAFFQILMFINEFVCVEVGPPHISIVLIQGIQGAQRGATNLRQKAIYVLPHELDGYADQPATLITTVLNLPNVDVRQLSTSLRGLLTDTNTQSMIPAGEHSVILQGFGSYIVSLARLLEIVDDESRIADTIQPVFTVIPLQYAAAEDVADLMDQLLEARDTTRGRNLRRPAEAQGVSTALAGPEVETKILVDARTNSLLVMALPEEMPRIKDLVARLDIEVVEPERNYHIYNLQNVKAEDLAETLDEFLSDAERVTATAAGGTGGRAPGQAGGQGGGSSQSNEVVVVPDENSNSLLIAANKTRYEEVLELVRQLDRRQDQVLIETALIELSGQDFRDIGVEWALADVTGDGGFGATSFGLSSFMDSDDDGIPDLRIPNTDVDGITAGILSGDNVNLPFLIAAVQRLDEANVLNVPSVLVNNNGSARVTTLDEQPTTQVTTPGSGNTTQTNFAGFQEAGITLEISPSISLSRYLRLDISLEVSTFQGAFDAASTIPPPRITRELVTTVNVPDGDTMVIGGIITDNKTHTRRATPFLGDIPLLGALFRRDSKTSDKTTLYFFVTPHILRDRDFADLAEYSYRKKLDAAEVIGPERVRVVDPAFGDADEGGYFEGFQLPLYRSPARGEVAPEEVGLDPQRRRELWERADGGTTSSEDGE